MGRAVDAAADTEFGDFMATRWPGLVQLGYGLTSDRQAAKDLKRSTTEGYTGIVEGHLIPELGRRQLAAIDAGELDRYLARKRKQKLAARTAHMKAARRALAMRRAASFPPRPAPGDTDGEGMRALPSQRRRARVPPAKIGRFSQATKNAQAARDARNRSVQ